MEPKKDYVSMVGEPRGGKPGKPINQQLIAEVAEMANQGFSLHQMAKALGISHATAANYKKLAQDRKGGEGS